MIAPSKETIVASYTDEARDLVRNIRDLLPDDEAAVAHELALRLACAHAAGAAQAARLILQENARQALAS